MSRPDELTFAPLGGVGEIGMNLSIYGLGNRQQRSWLAVDLGVSFGDEEHLPGTRCVAAPIYDEHAEPLGAISLAGPSSRLPDARIRQLGPLVSDIAEEITGRLGGRWPHPR